MVSCSREGREKRDSEREDRRRKTGDGPGATRRPTRLRFMCTTVYWFLECQGLGTKSPSNRRDDDVSRPVPKRESVLEYGATTGVSYYRSRRAYDVVTASVLGPLSRPGAPPSRGWDVGDTPRSHRD